MRSLSYLTLGSALLVGIAMGFIMATPSLKLEAVANAQEPGAKTTGWVDPQRQAQWQRETGAALLKRFILKELSGLDSERVPDWEKVTRLRHWVALQIDLAMSGYEHVSWPRDPDAYSIFADYFEDKGGVFCGGSALTLARTYKLFGFESFYLNVGWQTADDTATHAVTVVAIEHENRRIYTIQDAYFDVTYVKLDGEPYDLAEMVETLRRRRHRDIQVQTVPGFERDIIASASRNPLKSWTFYGEKTKPKVIAELPNGRVKYRGSPTLQKYAAALQLPAYVEAKGFPADPIYFFLHPLGIGDAAVAWAEEYLEEVWGFVPGS